VDCQVELNPVPAFPQGEAPHPTLTGPIIAHDRLLHPAVPGDHDEELDPQRFQRLHDLAGVEALVQEEEADADSLTLGLRNEFLNYPGLLAELQRRDRAALDDVSAAHLHQPECGVAVEPVRPQLVLSLNHEAAGSPIVGDVGQVYGGHGLSAEGPLRPGQGLRVHLLEHAQGVPPRQTLQAVEERVLAGHFSRSPASAEPLPEGVKAALGVLGL